MSNFANFCLVLCCLILPTLVSASDKKEPHQQSESESSLHLVPFNIGLFPYADINAYKYPTLNYVTIDFIIGHTQSVHGVAIGGAASLIRKELRGVQISGAFNFAQEVSGLQLGLVNVGKNVHGAQIGLINIANDVEGATVGIINLVNNGRHSVDVWTSDTAVFNAGVKLGSDRVYSILGMALQPRVHSEYKGDEITWGPGLGIGVAVLQLDSFSVAVESITFIYFDEDNEIDKNIVGTFPNALMKLRIVGGYAFNDMWTIYLGPTLNVNIGFRDLDRGISYLREGAIIYRRDAAPPMQIGIGFVAGVQIF